MMYMNFNYWLFMIPAFIITLIAQMMVNAAYRRWSRKRNSSGVSGAEAARRMLTQADLYDVTIEPVSGTLSDHYDPRSQTLRLSQGVARGDSVAALAIAAHEIGHALQDSQDYFPLRIRAALVPAVNIGSSMGWILILLGLFLGGTLGTNMAWLGVAAFALGLIFALATLPVELNASKRAHLLLADSGYIQTREEQQGTRAVLNAAAWTYVAAIASAALQLLYFVNLVGGRSRRR
ncbi:MAG: zinc metallopeptidase [Anaerolineales bacterium]|nr:zinc metallopeptidase [Anaerolineales bacterium]